MMFRSLKTKREVNNGTHPLIKALEDNDNSALVWAHALVIEVKGTTKKNWNIVMYFRDRSKRMAEIKSEEIHNSLMQYFIEKFPDVSIGYDDETRKIMKEQYGFSR